MKTLQIVGFKNSGKTTLISSWIQLLKANGLRVAVIKHHGHGAKLSMPDESKDSMQYLEHGADASIVSGGGYTQHILQRELDFAALKKLALLEDPDILFVEGYKDSPGEKVVLVGEQSDWNELQLLENIKLVVGLNEICSYPQIKTREDSTALNAWIITWAGK